MRQFMKEVNILSGLDHVRGDFPPAFPPYRTAIIITAQYQLRL